jgi:hypothetical protein
MRLARCEPHAGRKLTSVARVFDRECDVIMSDRARAKVRRVQPNGQSCPPVCFTGSLEFRGDAARLTS